MRTTIDRLPTGIENKVDILDFDGYNCFSDICKMV